METLSFKKTTTEIIARTQFTKNLLNAYLKVYKISANVVMFKV